MFCGYDSIALRRLGVPLPLNEARRIEILRESNLLDTNERDPEFDRYTSLGQRTFKTEICLISLVDVERQWFKSRVGLKGNQTDRNSSFCTFACLPQSSDLFIVLDALEDKRFKRNPLVLGPPHIRFYAGARLIVDGLALGSFCIIDPKPRPEFSLSDQMLLLSFGAMVSNAIVMRRSQEFRLQEKINRPFQMKCYVSMNLLSLKHNLRTPLSTLSMQLQCESSPGPLTLKNLQMKSRSVEQIVEICLLAVETLVSNDTFTLLQHEHANSSSPRSSLSSPLQIIEEIIKLINQIKTCIKVQSIVKVTDFDKSVKSHPQLLLFGVVVNLCHAMRLAHGIPNSEIHVSAEIEEDNDPDMVDDPHAPTNPNPKNVQWTGNIVCRITLVLPPYSSISSSASNGGGVLDRKTLDRLRKTQSRSELNQMIDLVGGGVSVRDVSGNLELGCWVPYSRELVEDVSCSSSSCDPSRRMCDVGTTEGKEKDSRKESTKLLRVLLVDDSVLVHEQFRDTLRGHYCDLVSVCNGALGLYELQKSTSFHRRERNSAVTQANTLTPSDSKNVATSNFTNLALDPVGGQACEVRRSYDIVFVDLLMPTKSGVDMMRDYREWIQGEARVCNINQPTHSRYSLSSSVASSVTLKKLVGEMGGPIFVALLPLGCTFDEMVMMDDGCECNIGCECECLVTASPMDYGFDLILDKPLEMSHVVDLLSMLRESMSPSPSENPPPQSSSAKVTSTTTGQVDSPSSLDHEPPTSVSFLQFFRQLFSRKIHPA